ncbi:DNA-binding proteins Bright/BRCAA1/RBP1 and proteins containing BRIGHT domain [Maudiozyma exigua]|uniref:DNA-binding proteins Bright/BRCAA1/RBP1 and proteins containing BRIGHT domain n=1 Tax=Maudiozyma exigua TaxID=34358 RepID=A0A9P7B630_MAUEX|nr:DNA-binding proteins Bright/BRCAA1/RBP1 and proteins containing BRIGHT domain [Kazachstania exigua]
MVTEQIKITNPMGSTTQPVGIDTTSPTGNKPLAITSVEAQNAVHMVTPERISTLLENRGPLAIRFITQSLSEDIPYFKNLSTSKQRRLIMNVMETGYESKSLIFEKIGWGLWTIKQVSPQTFKQERDITNKLNAKVRDNSNNPNLTDTKRRSSNSNNIRKKSQIENNVNNNSAISSNVPLSPKLKAQQNSHHILSNNANNIPRSVVYIDENVLQTDEEDNNVFSEEDEEEEDTNIGSRFGLSSNNLNNGRSKSNNINNSGINKVKNEHEDFVHSMIKPNGSFSFNRRKSSVVYDNDTNGTIEQEMLAQKIRPIIKNRSRRSSSKGRPIHILGSNSSNTNSVNINGNSIVGSPLSGTRILDNESVPPLPKILYSDNDNDTNIVGPVIPLRKGSISGPLNTTTTTTTNVDIKPNNRGSFSESVSRRSSSRVSVSKESGIRSTLLHTLNDSHVNSNNNNGTTSNNLVYSQFGTFQNSGVPIIEQKDQILATATTNLNNNNNITSNNNDNNSNMVMNSPHSDTDEEDWANIGAESLRTMSNDISPVQTNNKLANNNLQQQLNNPDDADDAARVLLSLK